MSEYLDEQVNPSESSLEFIDTAINLSAALHNDGVLSREMAAIDNAEVDDEASSPTLKLKRIRSDRQHSIERRITDWLDMQGIFQVDPSSKRDVYYENKRHALLAMKLPQQLKLQRLTAHTHGHGQSRQGSKDGHDDDSQRHINNAPSHFQISLNKLTRSHLFARRQHNALTVATAAASGGGHNNLHGNKHHHHVHHAANTHRQSNHGLLQRRFRQEQCEEEEVEVDMEDRDFIEDGFNKEEQGQIMKQHRIGTAGGLEEGRREEKQERLEQVGISDDGFLLSEKNSDEDCNQLRFQGQQQILNNLHASTTATTIAVTNSSCEEDLAMEGMQLSSKGELKLSNSSIEAKKIPSKQKQQQQQYRQIRSSTDSQATIDTEMESEEQDQEQTDGVVLSSSPKEKVQEEQLA